MDWAERRGRGSEVRGEGENCKEDSCSTVSWSHGRCTGCKHLHLLTMEETGNRKWKLALARLPWDMYVCMYGPSVVTALTTVHRTAPQTRFLLTHPAPSPPGAATHSCVLGRWATTVYTNVKTLLIIIIIAQQHIPSFSRMSFSLKG